MAFYVLLLIFTAIAYDYLNARKELSTFIARKELSIFNQSSDLCAKVSASPSAMPTGTAPCSVCGKVMTIRLDGNVKIHGPVLSRCAGSGVPPAVSTSTFLQPHQPTSPTLYSTPCSDASQIQSTSSVQTSDSIINPGPTTVRVLKRIPRGSRAPFARKFASILDSIVIAVAATRPMLGNGSFYSVDVVSACQAVVATEEA